MSPSSADIGTKRTRVVDAGALARTRGNRRRCARTSSSRVVDQVHLVDRDDEVRDAEQVRERRVAARLRDDAVARVDQQDRELRGADAAVTMLRVYCSWPGASAMMNLRSAVAK